MPSLRFILFCLPGALFALPILASLTGASVVWARSPNFPVAATPLAETVTLTATDGVRLGATYWPGRKPSSPGVLIMHGIFASRQMYAAQAAWLAKQGFGVLTIDLRGHGDSAAALHAFGLTESRDARAGFDWLKSRQHGAPVGVIGISLGGAAALIGDHGPLPAQAFVLVCVYSDIDNAIRNRVAAFAPEPFPTLLTPLLKNLSKPLFGVGPDHLRPIVALRKVKAPVLIVGGGADSFTPPEESRAMLSAAGGAKELLLLDGMDHARATWADTEPYRERLKAFFTAAVGAPWQSALARLWTAPFR